MAKARKKCYSVSFSESKKNAYIEAPDRLSYGKIWKDCWHTKI